MKSRGKQRTGRHGHTHEEVGMKDVRGVVAKAIIPNIPHVMSGAEVYCLHPKYLCFDIVDIKYPKAKVCFMQCLMENITI